MKPLPNHRSASPASASLAVAFLLAASLAGAQDKPAPAKDTAAPAIDAKATEAMRKMATFLAAAKQFTVEAEETFDAEFASAYRIQLTNIRRLTMERPGRFKAVAEGDSLDRSSWYDGKSLTVLNRKKNLYAVLDMPGTIDAVLDALASDYGVILPLSDLLYADPYRTMMDGVLYGKYLGVHQAAGVPCHHLSFGQEGVAWQIWIDAGAQPLPRKLAMAYWEDSAVPQYTAILRHWNLAPRVAPGEFTFVAPAGAKKADLSELRTAQ